MLSYPPRLLAVLVSMAAGSASTVAMAADDGTADVEASTLINLDTVQIVGDSSDTFTASGSAWVLDSKDLEENEYTDIHRIVREVPGVYFQEEDGYGLRPNIGIRGSGSGRSSKITLMEDGILMAPAPYSAPSAYYFPVTGRMSGLEVLKGPDLLRYGPYTVGGAVNLLSTPVPAYNGGMVNVEMGENGEVRNHVWMGGSKGQWGALLEAHQHETDGYKNIDYSDADTGFDKSDYVLKLRWRAPSDAALQQQVELKLQRDTEVSNETYLGLTDADFRADPNRRYSASEFDRMETEHESVVLRHKLFFNDTTSLTTALYRNDFYRNWYKADRINGDSIGNVIADANGGDSNASAILQGTAAAVPVTLKNNARDYVSSGVQMELNNRFSLAGMEHDWVLGARVHEDEIDRFQPIDNYTLENGRLAFQSTTQPNASNNRLGEADATAFWLVDHISVSDALKVTASLRHEDVDTRERRWADLGRDAAPTSDVRNNQSELMAGLGATYLLSDNWSVLAGVHEGFAPAGAGSADGVEPETSINYEAGFRFRGDMATAEVIAFFSDYENTVQNCSLANPCPSGAESGSESFGESDIRGIEFALRSLLWSQGALSVPAGVTYTWTDAEVTRDADDGSVLDGDVLPYLPEHLASASVALEHTAGWSLGLNASYTDSMCIDNTCDRSSVDATFLETDSYVVFDTVAQYRLSSEVDVYARIDNILDDQEIVARSPAGARPNKPRTAYAGIKVRF